MNNDFKNMTFEQITDMVAQIGVKPYFAKYIFSFVHGKHTDDIQQITTLSKPLRQQLIDAGYQISSLQTAQTLTDADGTVKMLFQLPDDNPIESVLLTTDKGRKTLCISSQSGCRMACKFCATGQLGFKRNLTAAEIVDQFYQATIQHGTISNVVYMGMGEPFDNYDNVMDSVRILNHPHGQAVGARHITVSTCGIPHAIERFATENLQVRLAISLHAPEDALRIRLMPSAVKYPLDEIMDATRSYQDQTNRRVTIEYCMIEATNDSDRHAKLLANLLKGIDVGVNLIEFNPFRPCNLRPSSRNQIHRFKDILTKEGVETIVRYKRGQKINAACGQLGAAWLKKS